MDSRTGGGVSTPAWMRGAGMLLGGGLDGVPCGVHYSLDEQWLEFGMNRVEE